MRSTKVTAADLAPGDRVTVRELRAFGKGYDPARSWEGRVVRVIDARFVLVQDLATRAKYERAVSDLIRAQSGAASVRGAI
jgi:hypothetical protein